jgi:hypothetical protein
MGETMAIVQFTASNTLRSAASIPATLRNTGLFNGFRFHPTILVEFHLTLPRMASCVPPTILVDSHYNHISNSELENRQYLKQLLLYQPNYVDRGYDHAMPTVVRQTLAKLDQYICPHYRTTVLGQKLVSTTHEPPQST